MIRILFQHPGGSYRTKLHINVPQDLLEDAYRTRRESALGPRRLVRALESGGRSVLSVAATTATAGIIVGVVTLTGLEQLAKKVRDSA